MSQLYKKGQLYLTGTTSGLTLGTIPNHKAVLFNAVADLTVTGKMFLGGGTGDSGNTLETAGFTFSATAKTSIIHPIRYSSISEITGTGNSIVLLN